MNPNSQIKYYPPQPDNPGDSDQFFLSSYALALKGWPEDFDTIKGLMSPPPDITSLARPGARGMKVGVIGGGQAGSEAAFEPRKISLSHICWCSTVGSVADS